MGEHYVLLAIGCLLFAGLLADEIGRRTRFPRVTLLMLVGIAAGPSGLDLLPKALTAWYDFLATIALTMVAFLLGGKMSLQTLQDHGRPILLISATVVLLTAVVTAGGLMLTGVPTVLALLLAGIATATAPAAIQDVVQQSAAKGPFSELLLGIVAVDDAWGLVLFSLILVGLGSYLGDGLSGFVLQGLWELFGAVVVGLIVGLPAAFLTGRLQPGRPSQLEALGLVLVCAGLSLLLGVSFLLAGIVAGASVVNLASHHDRPFHAIEDIEWPFMVLFFVLAGATVHFDAVAEIGWIGLVYVMLRTACRLGGGWLGGWWANVLPLHRNWIGSALMPQAGVAIGMALVAANHYPAYAERLLALTVGTTVVFELLGPVLTLTALRRVGEAD